jgi:RNA polymerase sigma factor for flagellar operon FliA
MDSNLAIMWNGYKQSKDMYYRDKLLAFYRPFLKNIVNFISAKIPLTVDRQDIHSYGYLGLLDAINKFDTSRNIKFETYASYRIKGAIIDGIRKQDWLSKSLRTKCKEIAEREQLYQDAAYSGEPSDEFPDTYIQQKPAEQLGNKYYLYSFDDPDFYKKKYEESNEYVGTLYSEYARKNSDFTERLENRMLLKKILSKLSIQEKQIVYLYYFKGLTFKQIGRKLNVTESRISQINSRIMDKLRKQIRN